MAEKTQMASFAKRLGGQVAKANAEFKDKPVDTGNMRLPPGIKQGEGFGKVQAATFSEYQDDKNGPGTKGQVFFRIAAVAVSPQEKDGAKVAGIQFSKIFPICAMPASGARKATTLSENWDKFQNFMKTMGVPAPDYSEKTDPTGQKTEAYYFAAAKSLTDPNRPVFVSFSTRAWTPPARPNEPKPEPITLENWHGKVDFTQTHNPEAGVKVGADNQPTADDEAPAVGADGLANNAHEGGEQPREEEVAALVEVAMSDPQGETDEGKAACARLEELAWELGWTPEDTQNADDWAQIGDMALAGPDQDGEPQEGEEGGVTVGSVWNFCKRDKGGNKLKNNKGVEYPSIEVEVVTVNLQDETCTVKTTKDGKEVVDIRTKKPTIVKFAWLE